MRDDNKFKHLFNKLSNPAVLISNNGNVLENNKAAVNLFKELAELTENTQSSDNYAYDFLKAEIFKFIKSKKSTLTLTKQVTHQTGDKYYEIILSDFPSIPNTTLVEIVNLTELQHIRRGMDEITKGILSTVGEEFFDSVVTHLTRATNADYVLISEFSDETKINLRTVALSIDGKLSDGIEYQLETTPCYLVIYEGPQYIPGNVIQKFPEDELAKELEVDSYFGYPLTNSKGETTGLMAIMGKVPLRDADFVISTLKLFSVRASAELERRQNEMELENNIKFLNSLLDAIPNPIFYKDKNGVYLGCNNELEKAWGGMSKSDIVGHDSMKIAPADWARYCDKTDSELMLTGKTVPYENQVKYADGSDRTVMFNKAIFFKDSANETAGIIGTLVDISDIKKAEKKIERLAYFDSVTNLPNRELLKERLSTLIHNAEGKYQKFAILLIDLDRFKNINDTLGHTIGDQLLREVAELLNTSLNPCDTLSNTNGEIDLNSCDTIARIGGDEFVVVLNGVDEIQASKKSQ